MTEHIQLVDDLGAEFSRVAAEHEDPSRPALPRRLVRSASRPRAALIALGMTAALCGTAYGLPATRGTVTSITDSLASVLSGDRDKAPGRAVAAGEEMPAWFAGGADGELRVIAETAGVRLYVRTVEADDGPRLEFGLGRGRIMVDTVEGWSQRMGPHAVAVLGSTLFGSRQALDDQGRFPLLGLTVRDARRVELRYADDGPPTAGPTGDGGFVLLADAWRSLRQLIAYDSSDHVLDRIDVSEYDLRSLCEKEPTCPSQASSGGR